MNNGTKEFSATISPSISQRPRSGSRAEMEHDAKYDYQLLYIVRKYAILTVTTIITIWILSIFIIYTNQ